MTYPSVMAGTRVHARRSWARTTCGVTFVQAKRWVDVGTTEPTCKRCLRSLDLQRKVPK